MASKQELVAELAAELADVFTEEIYGPEGPSFDTDIDEIEEAAVLAARASFNAVIGKAMRRLNRRLPDQIPCPKCKQRCPVRFEERTIQGRLGQAEIEEPVCFCSACDRDFFPYAGSIAAR